MIRDTLSAVDGLINQINTHPEFGTCARRRIEQSLIEDAMRHSIAMERTLGNHSSGYNSRQILDKEYGTLSDAIEVLRESGFSQSAFVRLGSILEPTKNGRGYRRVNSSHPGEVVVPSGRDDLMVRPIPSEQIPFAINNLIYFLENGQVHPVVRAAEAHLELVRIHPYADGNGRLGRLAQNYALAQRGYPSALIKDTDRAAYYLLLQGALVEKVMGEGRPENPSKTMERFYEFIGGKVLDSTRILRDELLKSRAFRVSLRVRDPGIGYSIKNIIHGKANLDQRSVIVSMKKNGRAGLSLLISGDVSREEIINSISKLAKRHRVGYSIESLGC